MLFKCAINKADIIPLESKQNSNIKYASKWADINAFPERFKRLIGNYVTANAVHVGEYNPEFKYYRVIALHGDVPNQNADAFEWGDENDNEKPELLRFEKSADRYVYQSFTGRGNYKNHDNDDVTKAVGLILDVAPNIEGKFIEALLAVDTKKDPELIRGIDNGYIDSVSMGALCGHSICSVCDNIAHTPAEYCNHIKYSKGKQVYHEGQYKLAYEINRSVSFIELSWVSVPADPDAKLLEKVAENNNNLFKMAFEKLDRNQLNYFLSYVYGFAENKFNDYDYQHLNQLINILSLNKEI